MSLAEWAARACPWPCTGGGSASYVRLQPCAHGVCARGSSGPGWGHFFTQSVSTCQVSCLRHCAGDAMGTVPWSCPHRAHSLATHSDLSQEACITGVGEKAYVSFLEWPGSQLGRGQPRSRKVAAPASRHCRRSGSGASWGLALRDLPHHLIPFTPSFLAAPPTSKQDSTPGPLHWLFFHLGLSPRHLQGFCSFTRFRCHPPSQ